MSTSISATEVWARASETAVDVRGQTTYRIVFNDEEAHILAPGLDKTVEMDEEIYPLDDLEACAVILVAQLEGGVDL